MIFGFPRLPVPVSMPNGQITKHWYRLLVQMANVLGTVNYGTAQGVTASSSSTILTMTVGQAFKVHAFNQANSANNAVADAFYDGTTLTLSNLVTNGSGVTIVSSSNNLQVKNTSASTINIAWRVR